MTHLDQEAAGMHQSLLQSVRSRPPLRCSVLALMLGLAFASAQAQQNAPASAAVADADDLPVLDEVQVMAASEQVKQAPGVSVITSEDIERTPVTNDISEIVRRQPGVNLTGNTSSGARGNQRQIDIRGMGPENTLILIDGKPVLSRNAVRYGIGGERDTRGDSNWVPPEAIESIEVLRGPAAARYGSGAAGGVVNIRTKAATQQAFNVNVFTNVPEDSREGDTRRVNVLASGPVNEMLSYRLYGNFNVTDHDKPGLNGPPAENTSGFGALNALTSPAGREGVENRDVSGRLTLRPNTAHRFDLDATWSRQSNRYAGDTLLGTVSNANLLELANAGKETNRMTRRNLSLTHLGSYGFGSSESFIQWESTLNRRMVEGMSGPVEGVIATTGGGSWETATLNNLAAKSEFHIPLRLGVDQVLTLGVDFRRESLDDPASIRSGTNIPAGVDAGIPNQAADRDTKANSRLIGVYLEDNLYIGNSLILTPGLRLDHHDKFGLNTSPSLNASYAVNEQFTLKGGIARAFKAPNLYQLNPNYLYYSAGWGCWGGEFIPCYILGNADLDPEISLNKEIGIAFQNDSGWAAGVTYFHNRYRNRIVAGRTAFTTANIQSQGPAGIINAVADFQRWENSGPATVAGFEGNLTVPLSRSLNWSSNFTYMSKSEDDQGQPLSLVPQYTVNTWLDWRATDKLGVNVGLTHYGKTESRTTSILTGVEDIITVDQTRSAYTLVNLGLDYRFNRTLRLSTGVKNLFDKQLLRTSQGANTFNEPGRSYYVGLNAAF